MITTQNHAKKIIDQGLSVEIFWSPFGLETCFPLFFAADVVLDEEPWLNATTSCTFPDPFFPDAGLPQQMQEQFSDIGVQHSPDVSPNASPVRGSKIKQYVGQYGNFGFGNVSVEIDDVLQQVIVNLDVMSCLVLNQTESFSCLGLDNFWFFHFPEVSFDETNNPSQFLDFTFVVEEGPIRFERDLEFADAPGPTDDWPQWEVISEQISDD